ncbi:DeoR family fructose operon transcriptional repressor [Conyzicola lurida]|uniref:Lactose phosphotransferase system repressor n=1 Tax=Conyzicola lurida TaxID=1172621 RepID=A0A841AN70_9MICO|nr:DeoR/GlpR family DNA-binding transcription regulator [Conyzicola lurida]MBB5842985.1 DeoR family fructose operon transcriptional repressor [Conyzicola lurida]
MYADERQFEVERIVLAQGRAAVVDLAKSFNVTTETIRRDLAQLEERGTIRRVHGGAVMLSKSSRAEKSIAQRVDINARAKAAIADRAMKLLPPTFRGAVALDAGTTTALLADRIARWTPESPEQSLVVITHSIAVAAAVAVNPHVEVQLLGGRLRGVTGAAVGASTLAQLARIRPDVAFIGANGVHADFGLSTPDDDEAAVKTALTRGSRRAVALVDASKLGEEALVRFAQLDDLDTLITDEHPADDLRTALETAEVEVLVA